MSDKPKNVFKVRVKEPESEEKSKKSEVGQTNTKWKNKGNKKTILGLVLMLIGLFLFLAFLSYLFTWKIDQDRVLSASTSYFTNADIRAQNMLGKAGAWLSHQFFYNGIGISSFFISTLFLVIGFWFFVRQKFFSIGRFLRFTFIGVLLLPLIMGFVFYNSSFSWGGAYGLFVNEWLQSFIGKIGTLLLYAFLTLGLAIIYFDLNINQLFNRKKKEQSVADTEVATEEAIKSTEEDTEKPEKTNRFVLGEDKPPENEKPTQSRETSKEPAKTNQDLQENKKEIQSDTRDSEKQDDFEIVMPETKQVKVPSEEGVESILDDDLALEVTAGEEEKQATHFGIDTEYDPTLELADYKFPTLDFLESHGETNIEINREDLERNKEQIVETLRNYKIEISKIKATVGPTVTLYEIIPAPGVRISKIKNLEDDIALSLAALGIRIIAPIPGKGTIGIEVPNTHPNIVSMKSMLASEKFVHSKAALPIAVGKTISNENYIADLAKMPHLLIAGATGQGKSVGINSILVSLLYKKHPSELKFVLVDPKKVELSIYSKITNHYLAQLPGEAEPIITDTAKVVNTLNSLCVEMDDRYELLKNAHCRNVREYNQKFKARRLNPEKGHRYLPYIVLVVDEFADLIMTAGKEVESPIARLAQLARAIGIHLIIATQRPSVNIITGIIKANFPARIAFRVMSKVDSRTILDMGGADQLIGRGDLILSIGSEAVRLQCPFVDTPEVDEITDFIGKQDAFDGPYLLPEVSADGESGSLDDGEELDELFADAARLVVSNDSGSTSMLQRRLKLGYNRAGRIMDQLERAGIVGPSKGSKPREVLLFDEMELERFLENLL